MYFDRIYQWNKMFVSSYKNPTLFIMYQSPLKVLCNNLVFILSAPFELLTLLIFIRF